jgi:transcriptional regulator with XRE-family HTH domain/predicted HTH domain antitoxin
VIAEALRASRERAGLSQEAAAMAVGVNRVQLSYFESGRRQPPLAVAATLARLYGTTLEDLLAGEESARQAIDVSGVLYRAAPRLLGDQAQAGLALLDMHLREYVELADDAGASLPGPGRSPLAPMRTASSREAASAARDLRRHLNLGGGPVADPFRTLYDQILIWRLPLGEDLGESPSGLFYSHPQAGFCVAVNSQMTLGRQVFTLAHELAHAYFHSQSAGVVISVPGARDQREVFADAFAGEFLAPGDELRRVAGELAALEGPAQPAVAVHLQRHFGVSFATIRVRLFQERLISRAEYEALADVSPSQLALALGYSVHPADMGSFRLHPLDRFPARVLQLTRTAVERSIISQGDAAEVLGTSTEEVRELLARPSADDDDRRIQRDLEDAAFGDREW